MSVYLIKVGLQFLFEFIQMVDLVLLSLQLVRQLLVRFLGIFLLFAQLGNLGLHHLHLTLKGGDLVVLGLLVGLGLENWQTLYFTNHTYAVGSISKDALPWTRSAQGPPHLLSDR